MSAQRRGISSGDVSQRRALRQDLGCGTFQSYLDNVAPHMFAPIPENYHNFGRLRNLATGECVYHEGNPAPGGGILAVMRPCEGPTVEEGRYSVTWYHTKKPGRGQLRHEAEYGSRCIYAHELKAKARVSLVRCYDHELGDDRLRWDYHEDSKQFSLGSTPSGCLTASKADRDQVIVSKCKEGLKRQMWDFLPF